MQNAHLRLGQLEYLRATTTIQTRARLHVDRFVGEHEQGHLLSVYGGDAEVGAIAAAVYEGHSFSLRFPDGSGQKICMGQDASCYRAGIAVRGRRQSLRHLVIASQALHSNGAAGNTYLLNYERTTAWATMVSLLGVPADPRWAEWILERLELDNQVVELQGIGCEPVFVTATRDRLLAEISDGLKQGSLGFPEENGPVLWPSFRIQDLLHFS
jgi:hypothetical protein